MGLAKTASAALNLLIDIGYFPVHVNLDLLKYNIHTDYSADLLSAAENLLAESSDQDEVYFLCNVYTIILSHCSILKNYRIKNGKLKQRGNGLLTWFFY